MDDQVDKALRMLQDFTSLGIVEDDGDLYLPTELRRRNKTGGVDSEPVLLRMPTNHQRYRARRDAETYAREQFGFTVEHHAKQIDEIENYALLAYAIRDSKTRGQLEPDLGSLIARFSDATLTECWARLNVWTDVCDPRFGEMPAEKVWQVIAGLAAGNLLPLVGMHTYEQNTCFLLMAKEACCSPNAPLWLTSPATWRSDSSTRPSSETSSAAPSPTASAEPGD